jgi:nitrogen-specific signal transduction histidine kinase
MRRETDFVLEQAAWPAMLLEENGRICRVNQAARRLFGLPGHPTSASLGSLWVESNKTPAELFLRELASGASANVQLRLAGGSTGPFVAHRASVVRDGQRYLVLQLFKDSAAPFPELAYSAPTPPSVPAAGAGKRAFALSAAAWPALLMNTQGVILKSNQAAARLLGAKSAAPGAMLAASCAPEDAPALLSLLGDARRDGVAVLKFRLDGGATAPLQLHCCAVAEEKCVLVQFFRINGTPPATTTGGETALFFKQRPESEVPTSAPTPGVVMPSAVEASQAQKQKLDCALQLARSVALDFNNALTSILGHASLLLGKAEAGHPWRGSLVEIEKSAAKAAEIANDLAAFSRQEKDVRVQMAGNLNALLERTLDAFESSLQKPVRISRQLERQLFACSFDEAKMQQALTKVLENALEATGGEGKIGVQSRNVEISEPTQDHSAKLTPGSYVCVEVSDSGAGIAPEVMPRIFEPFFTTKGAQHRGLGLAWVYGIVTNHGGAVAVSSQPGAGAAVRLYLPASRKIVRPAPPLSADLSGTQTILFVDDEDALLTLGRMILSSFGYTVLTANSGVKALEFFASAKKKIDLVITDMVMPNMSGRELTEQILRASPQTRVLWSSGYVRSTNPEEQERYLQKPFTSQDLLRKVKQVLSD